jgi:hypothetical protein
MKEVIHMGSYIDAEAFVEKYMSLPTVLWRSTDSQFEHICDKDQEVEKNKILCVGREKV